MATSFTLTSCVCGYLVYKDIWNPTVGETLNCEREARHPQDPYAISLRKDDTTVGHVPHIISCICMLFLRHGGFIEATVTLAVILMYLSRVFGESSFWVLAIAAASLFMALMVDCDILFGKELCLSCLK